MKKLIALLVLSLVLVSSLAFAGEETPIVVDSERQAQVWAGFEISRYNGWFGFYRATESSEEWVYGEFSVNLDGFISSLSIGDEEIVGPDDEPLSGLPSNQRGEAREYNLSVAAVDVNGNYLAQGNFYKSLLLPGDPIIIRLEASRTVQFVPYTLPDGGGASENFRLVLTDGSGQADYSSWAEGFFVWVYPTRVTSYKIANLVSGTVYVRGEIDPLGEGDSGDDENIVNMLIPTGITAVTFEDGGTECFKNQTLSGSIQRGGVSIPAQVYFMDMQESGGSIEISATTSVDVEIRRYTATGEMPLIDSTTGDDWLSIPSGYGKIVVTVTGLPKGEEFNLYFQRSLNSSYYGGGKG